MPMGLRDRLARWLGLEAKASQTAKLIAWTSAGQPVWSPRDYAALAREGYAKNAIVYRAVRMIAEAAASVPLLLFEGAARARRPSAARPARPAERRRLRRRTCSRPGTAIC